jgi:two-component system sensor histidine kinase KdpD
VRSGEHLIGILALARDVREFDADERDAALAVAATVAEALERERLTAAVAETAALRATERMRSEFFDTVSHELRTPLTAISAALELVEHRDGAQKGSPVDHARRNAERLRRTVDDLLDMARLRGRGIALNVRPVGCREVLEDVAAAHAPLAAQHDQRFSVRCDALDVDVDRARLAQALGNLVANALKYTPRGTLVELAAESAAGEVRFSVTDHGTGIPLAARPRLFERFYRVGRDSALTGSGLGLSIAKALVELHGGRIWLEDPPEGGTRFVIALPVAASRAAVAAGVAN